MLHHRKKATFACLLRRSRSPPLNLLYRRAPSCEDNHLAQSSALRLRVQHEGSPAALYPFHFSAGTRGYAYHVSGRDKEVGGIKSRRIAVHVNSIQKKSGVWYAPHRQGARPMAYGPPPPSASIQKTPSSRRPPSRAQMSTQPCMTSRARVRTTTPPTGCRDQRPRVSSGKWHGYKSCGASFMQNPERVFTRWRTVERSC